MAAKNVTITIEMENSAFEDGMGGLAELTNILGKLMGSVGAGLRPDRVWDSNGNHVGDVAWDKEGEDRRGEHWSDREY